MIAALAAGAVLMLAYGALSGVPQDSALRTATVWVGWLLALSIAIAVWRLLRRR